MNPSARIKIFVLDDSPVVLRGLEIILGENDEFDVGGCQLNAVNLHADLAKVSPDILVMDAEVAGTNAKEILFYLQNISSKVKLVIFTHLASVEYVKVMMRLGTAGFLLKNAAETVITNALRAVYNGDFFIDENLKEMILQKTLLRKPAGTQQKLTRREKEILQLLASNYNSQEISKKLFLSKKTIENHRSNMLLKFKVKNAASLVMKAIELGLLD